MLVRVLLCLLLDTGTDCVVFCFFVFQAEDGIRDLVRSRGLGDVYKRQEQLTPAVPPNCRGTVVVTELQLLKQMSHCVLAPTFKGGSKLLGSPPAGGVVAKPVPPNETPFQLQRTGASALDATAPVSYTHLTLPTSDLV